MNERANRNQRDWAGVGEVMLARNQLIKNSSEKRVFFFTYCSRNKDDCFKDSKVEVTPDKLYKGKNRIEPFMNECKRLGAEWGIFSDEYGLWLSHEKHKWYDKSPNDVTDKKKHELFQSTFEKLKGHDKVYFYAAEKFFRVHKLYKNLFDYLKKEGIPIERFGSYFHVEKLMEEHR